MDKTCVLYQCLVIIFFIILINKFQAKEIHLHETLSTYLFNDSRKIYYGKEMVIFDLDKTIWPFVVDKDVNESFAYVDVTANVDLCGLAPFPEVVNVLDSLQKEGFIICTINDCENSRIATNLIELMDLDRFLNIQENFPGQKINHIRNLHNLSGVTYEDMLYFSYDTKDILPILALNVTFCPIDDSGVTQAAVQKGLHLFYHRPNANRTIESLPSDDSILRNDDDYSRIYHSHE